MKFFVIYIIFLITYYSHELLAKTVRYELRVSRQSINLSGKKNVDFALTVNGSIPAPSLEFTEGDDAEILVINEIPDEEVSIHWHGILLPPLMDGVAYVNTPPIFSGKSFLFKFKIRQSGTYWYHSHTALQEQKGVYGAFIIHPKNPSYKVDKNITAVISDWTDENPDNVLKNLKKDGDFYLYKKNTVRSYLGALQNGALKSHLANEWTRMGGMDLSDVGYDAFLINGKKELQLSNLHPGQRIRLRLINASASSYVYVSLGSLPLKVISADGVDIEPVLAKEILMGMAETYDVLIEIPEHKNYELKISAQDGSGTASGWIGTGEKVHAPLRPPPNMYSSMDYDMHTNHESISHVASTDHSAHESHSAHHMPSPSPEKNLVTVETLTVDDIKAKNKTILPAGKIFDLKLVLGGDMERYVWHINNKAIHEDRTIRINEGDVVRFTFVNDTMMHHPMHLHGHFFRVLNKYGDYSPLKHTFDSSPHSTRAIEFLANEPGDWMLHCHNLYHMKSGMARVLSYSQFKPSTEMLAYQKMDPHLHDHTYFFGKLGAFTNMGEALFRLSKTWETLELKGESKKDLDHWENEGDLLYRKWLDNYTNLIAGGSYFHNESRVIVGVGYVLPFLVDTNWLIDSRAKARLDLERKFQWTKYFFSEVEITLRDGFDPDWAASLLYAQQWSWSAGLKLTEGNIGLGLQYKF